MESNLRTPKHSGRIGDIFLTPAVLSEIARDKLVGVKRVDIHFVKNQEYKRPGPIMKIVKQKVKPITDENYSENRAMGSESDGLDLCDEAIDKVAKANCVRTDAGTQILPEVNASQCAFHTKSDRSKNELLYMTNHHAGHLPTNRYRQKPISQTTMKVKKQYPKFPSEIDLRQLEKDIAKYPKYPSALPDHMPSKEFVMTWLLHGSEPDHHFPELTDQQNKKSNRLKKKKLGVYRKSYLSSD